MQQPRPRLTDIACEAGVTAAMVSFVLSGKRGSKAPTAIALRIREVAQRLGYVPNRAARSLITGRTRTVAIVLGENVPDPIGHQMLLGFTATMNTAGMDVLVRSRGENPLAAAEQLWQAGAVEGTAVFLYQQHHDVASRAHDLPFPSVAIGPALLKATVAFDPQPGLAAAVAHLAELGHRTLAWVHPTQVPPDTTNVGEPSPTPPSGMGSTSHPVPCPSPIAILPYIRCKRWSTCVR